MAVGEIPFGSSAPHSFIPLDRRASHAVSEFPKRNDLTADPNEAARISVECDFLDAAQRGTMEFTDIIYEKRDGIATITINRPKVMNAFRGETVDDMIAAFKDAGAIARLALSF